MADPLSQLNSKIFADHLHTSFKVHAGDGSPLTLKLVEVSAPPTPPNIELFSLVFRGPRAPR